MERSYEYTPFNLLVNFQNNLNGVESQNFSEHFDFTRIPILIKLFEIKNSVINGSNIEFSYNL